MMDVTDLRHHGGWSDRDGVLYGDSRACQEIETLRAEVERLRAVADRRGSLAVERRREIARLRLTDAERSALERLIPQTETYNPRWAETLRGLLERLG